MAQLDLSNIWMPDPARRSRAAVVRGMARLSYKQLRHRFLESLLILLGIALGVGVLTGTETFLRFSASLDAEVLRSQAELQAVNIRPRTFDTSQLWTGDAPAAVRLTPDVIEPLELTTEDLLAIKGELESGRYVVAPSSIITYQRIVEAGGRPAVADDGASRPLEVSLRQATPDEMAFRGRALLAGRMFSWEEYAEGRYVAVLEEESVEALFPGASPAEAVGQTFVATGYGGGQPGQWQVVGVVAKEELNPILAAMGPGVSADIVAYVPHTASAGEPVTLTQISVTPAEGVSTEQLVSDVEVFFAQRHGPERVSVTNPLEQLQELSRSQRTTVLSLMGIAAMALLVAAINILNLFTARVIRRRRLMSMSVALGADRRLLFRLTLTESLLLGVAGSLVGLLLARGIVAILRMLLLSQAASLGPGFEELFGALGLGWPDVLLGLAAGAGVSLAFGLYPAFLGASFDAAEGLKGE
ncbi:MAG: ABC transporter permease [Bacillota bacterium]|nr:hypothetical protein [Bacillota bacterium]